MNFLITKAFAVISLLWTFAKGEVEFDILSTHTVEYLAGVLELST